MKKLLLTAVILCMACAIGCRKDKTPDAAASATSSDTTALLCHAVATTRVPVSLGNDGSVDSIFYIRHDSTLCLVLSLDDDYLDSALTDNRSEQLFILRLAAAAPSLTSLMKLAQGIPANISVTVKGTYEQSAYAFRIPAPEARSLLIEQPDERARAEVKVQNRVAYQNKFYPARLDSCSTLLGMCIQDRYVTFRTEIQPEQEFLFLKQNRDSLNHEVVRSLEEQLADSALRRSLTDIAVARLGYRNRYISVDRKDSFDISFTPADLQKLVGVSDSMAKAAHEPSSEPQKSITSSHKK